MTSEFALRLKYRYLLGKPAKGPRCVYANIVPNTQRNIKLRSSSNLRGHIEGPCDQSVKFATGAIPRPRMILPEGAFEHGRVRRRTADFAEQQSNHLFATQRFAFAEPGRLVKLVAITKAPP